MKLLDLTLDVVIALTVMEALAYVTFDHDDAGLLTTMPAGIGDFFVGRRGLQYLAIGLLVAAVVVKVPLGRRIARRERAGRR